MSEDDDLARLKAALKSAPAPDPAAKAAALRLAEENFDALQESAQPARPTKTAAPKGGVLKGLLPMFANISLKPMMLATSSLVVVGVGIVLMQPGLLPNFQSNTAFREDEDLIIVEPAVEESAVEEALADVDFTFDINDPNAWPDVSLELAPQAQAPTPRISNRACNRACRDRFRRSDMRADAGALAPFEIAVGAADRAGAFRETLTARVEA